MKQYTFHAYMMSLLTIALFLLPLTADAMLLDREQAHREVRVGIFAMDGYHEMDASGQLSGYGYDCLQYMLRYTNWHYHYVGYHKSWEESLQMLENGEIDLLTSAQKTPDRLDAFAFSELPIGLSSTILTVKAGNTVLRSGDYPTYDGARIGMLHGNSRNNSLHEFSVKNGFTYTPVYYDSIEDLTNDLQEGKNIDAIATSNLRTLNNEWILDQFDPSPFYVITRKGDTHMMEEVNDALTQLSIYEPNWTATLFNKYYDTNNTLIPLTNREAAYLQELKDGHIIFHVAANPDNAPYSYVEDGTFKGIFIDLFAEIARRAGIEYEIMPLRSDAEYRQSLINGSADINLNAYMDYSAAERQGFMLTSPYIAIMAGKLTRTSLEGDVHSVAVPDDPGLRSIAETIANETPADAVEYQYYASNDECVQAVRNGTCDAAYLYMFTAQQYTHDDESSSLQYTPLARRNIPISIAVRKEINYHLLAILTKSVDSLTDDFVNQTIYRHTLQTAPSPSLRRYLHTHPEVIIGIVIFITLFIILLIVTIMRARASRLDHQRRAELERFIGYVCKANDLVAEIHPGEKFYQSFSIVDGHLQKTRHPYNLEHYLEKVHPDEYPLALQAFAAENLQHNIAENIDSYFEARIKRSSGTYCWFAHTLQPIQPTKFQKAGYILFRRNINDTKQAEEIKRHALSDALGAARHASEAKGQFLSRMSHEIRTPLNAIIGYLTLGQMPETPARKIQHCLKNSAAAARHLLNIINDVLDISAIESGHFKIAHEPFSMQQLLAEISSIFYIQAREKSLEFETSLKNIHDDIVISDAMRIRQILVNLLSNAIKFTPAGGHVTLAVRQAYHQENQILMTFRIQDTGIGISKEYMTRMFIPFEQESASTAQQFGGTGLGLSITRNLVSLLHGSIDVQSQPQQGSLFTVTLPLQLADPQEDTSKKNTDFSHIHVLVVDDKPNEASYVMALLEQCHVRSDASSDGLSALERIKELLPTDDAYNLCIIDWKLPGIDGIETARRIHKECGAEIPIIIVTAYDINEIEDDAEKAGVNKILNKPLFPSTIYNLLIGCFGKASPTVENSFHIPRLTGVRLLLAEDNEMNREIAIAILEQAGITIDSAIDGQDVLEQFQAAPPGTYHAILMDIQMPVMNGYEATKAIRASHHPEAKSIPIIAVTADVFTDDIARAMSSGMNDYISKPIDYPKLFNVLKKFL